MKMEAKDEQIIYDESIVGVKRIQEKLKLARTITLETDKGEIGTLQRNKMRDSNILKCKSESTKSATTNGGSNIAYGNRLHI